MDFFLGVQLHFTIDQQKIICRATNNAYMNMQTIENAYMMPATSAAQRAFNAHPNFVVFINGSSYNLCSFPVYNNLWLWEWRNNGYVFNKIEVL